MTETPRPVAPVLEKMHQFLLWLVPTVDRFPRSQKFMLGDRIQDTAPPPASPGRKATGGSYSG